MKNGYCPVIIPPTKRVEYITSFQKTDKGDIGILTGFIISVIYEETKAMERIIKRLSG